MADGFHEILVEQVPAGWQVSIAPALASDSPCQTFVGHGNALAFARLIRLQRGFKIVDAGRGRTP